MKKENRRMAQQRRAEERRKKELRRKISKAIVIGVPTLAVIILIVAIIVSEVRTSSENSSSDAAASTEDTSGTDSSSSDSSSSDNTSSDNGSDASGSDTTSYSTDTSLTVEDGDTVNIDYVGTIDGVEFDGGSTNGAGTDLVIGSGNYIDDFEEQLIGAHPGDTVEVSVTFPEDYGNEELNGQDAVFEVTVNGIYE